MSICSKIYNLAKALHLTLNCTLFFALVQKNILFKQAQKLGSRNSYDSNHQMNHHFCRTFYPNIATLAIKIHGVTPSESVFINATIAVSSPGVRPRFPNSSVFTFLGYSGGGQFPISRVL